MDSKKTILQYIKPNILPSLLWLIVPPIGIIMLLCVYLPNLSRANKYVKKLEKEGNLEKAAIELISPDTKRLMKGRVALSQNYLFCKGTGYLFSYDEIQWAYKHRFTQSFLLIPIKVTDSLHIGAKALRKPNQVAAMGKDKKDEIKDTLVEIARHNNQCLIGYTPENEAKFKALKK